MRNKRHMGVVFEKTVNDKFLEKEVKVYARLLKAAADIKDEKLKRDIKNNYDKLKRGQKGEEQVGEKLKYCDQDMYVMHDVYLQFEVNGYQVKSQIDYIVITKKNFYIIECKNWCGDLFIDEKQDFYLTCQSKEVKKIPSVYEQMRKQAETVRKLVMKFNPSSIKRAVIQSIFDNNCQLVLVLVNNEQILQKSEENGDNRERVLYIEKLNDFIKHNEKETKNGILSKVKKKMLFAWVDLLKSECKERELNMAYYKNKLPDVDVELL